MAKKEITPIDPDAKADEVEGDSTTEAERKTQLFKVGRKSARKTSSGHFI
jgi:hypothetical protein